MFSQKRHFFSWLYKKRLAGSSLTEISIFLTLNLFGALHKSMPIPRHPFVIYELPFLQPISFDNRSLTCLALYHGTAHKEAYLELTFENGEKGSYPLSHAEAVKATKTLLCSEPNVEVIHRLPEEYFNHLETIKKFNTAIFDALGPLVPKELKKDQQIAVAIFLSHGHPDHALALLKSIESGKTKGDFQKSFNPDFEPVEGFDRVVDLLFSVNQKHSVKLVPCCKAVSKAINLIKKNRSDVQWASVMHESDQVAFYEALHLQIFEAIKQRLPTQFQNKDKITLYNFGSGEAGECQILAKHLLENSGLPKVVMHLYDRDQALLAGAQLWVDQLRAGDTDKTRFSATVNLVDLSQSFPSGQIDIFVASGFLNHHVMDKEVALSMLVKIISRMSVGGLGIVSGLTPSWVTASFLENHGCTVEMKTRVDPAGDCLPFYVFKKN